MFKALFFLLKLAIFSAAVLTLGNVIRWDGRSISDQIKSQMSHPIISDSMSRLRGWSGTLVEDVKQGSIKRFSAPGVSRLREAASDAEEMSESERQKLRELIRELNRSE